MGYRLREHTADIAVEATAPDLGGLFGAIADGLAAAMCESISEDCGDRFEIECRAESVEALLYEYLDQLIYERDVRLVLPVDNEAQVREPDQNEWLVTASARGVPLAEVSAREIKAVTYSEMDVDRRDAGWYGYVVFDV
ncbi:SHS2 domain-containing protein [Halohasta litchfieldiae]|uniref:SHS2 domain-containing protein n=1 Tax=Halohasta litchfieldiae TaxID=1073996 RepID=A0A1H6SWQ8_9EURY|nr:archease [Halohasta litchfieldiae]ATW87009.1 SHS2 domain-containing protein [Halohasta litchfieldiae]SEI72323.1 SHS2 domain-containing protein [Halohasta litchfieldiae]